MFALDPASWVESAALKLLHPTRASANRSLLAAMSTYKSDFLHVLAARGFIHQVSEPEVLNALGREKPITAYIGFDCTAASLHVDSLLPIMILYSLHQTPHPPIPLFAAGP